MSEELSTNASTYIMRPDQFKEVLNILNFTRFNGKNYFEHICIIFKDILTDTQKKTIREMTDETKALEYIGSITKYTHS